MSYGRLAHGTLMKLVGAFVALHRLTTSVGKYVGPCAFSSFKLATAGDSDPA
jgi:hypothetical protein